MKTHKACLSLLLVAITFLQQIDPSMFGFCYQKYISKTIIKTRTLSQYGMPFIDILLNNGLLPKEHQKITVNGIITGTKSTNKTFACEFLIDRKPIMLIAGNDTPYQYARDIDASFVGGTKNTVAQMTLGGNESLCGARILSQIPFFRLTKNDFFIDCFLGVRTALTKCSRKLELGLSGQNENELLSIRNFFAHQAEYGKIDNENRSEIGLENVTLTLDSIYYSKDRNLQLYYFSGVEIPVQSNYSSEYLFSPTIGGGNGTIALILGADLRNFFLVNDSYKLGILFELENHFFLYKTMSRTFDLYGRRMLVDENKKAVINNKPWSRYLPASSPYLDMTEKTVGTYSTLPVRIHPSNVLDISIGMIYDQTLREKEHCMISIGYNFWASQAEYSELQDREYRQPYQDFYAAGISGTLPYTSSSSSNIRERKENDATFQTFTYNELDMGSVAADGGYSQSAFLRATVIKEEQFEILVGGWYEFGKSLMIPSRVGGWIGGGLSF